MKGKFMMYAIVVGLMGSLMSWSSLNRQATGGNGSGVPANDTDYSTNGTTNSGNTSSGGYVGGSSGYHSSGGYGGWSSAGGGHK